MRTRFGPSDEHAFHKARDELVDRFESTPSGAERGWIAAPLLEFKWGHLDGDLANWPPEHLDELLLGLFPAKVLMAPEDMDEVIPTCVAFLEFLGSHGILAGGETAGREAAEHVRTIGPAFAIAARDRRRWGMGKRLWDAAAQDGVEPGDVDAFQVWMDAFNARPFEERDAILGPMPGEAGPAARRVRPLPPVVLAPTAELVAAARKSVWTERLRRLVEFVGTGRALTDTRNFKLADGKALIALLETNDRFEETHGDRTYRVRSSSELSGVDLTFAAARQAGYLAVEGKKVVPGPRFDEPAADPLEAIYRVGLALLDDIGPTRHHFRGERYNFGWYAAALDDALLPLLLDLYRWGEPEPIDDLVVDVWDHLDARFDLDDLDEDRVDMHQDSVDWSMRRAFDLLADLGLVTVTDEERIPARFGLEHRFGGRVALTDLGRWFVNRYAAGFTAAPVVGELRDETAASLLAAAADLGDDAAAAEIAAWVSHHGDAAADLLVDALPHLGETARGLGLRALLGIGEPAAAAVERLAADPALAPYATVWRAHLDGAPPASVHHAGDGERFVGLLAAVIELGAPGSVPEWADLAAGDGGLPAMLDTVWRVESPDTATVLATIGEHHPDKSVAKSARKALFKHRTHHRG